MSQEIGGLEKFRKKIMRPDSQKSDVQLVVGPVVKRQKIHS